MKQFLFLFLIFFFSELHAQKQDYPIHSDFAFGKWSESEIELQQFLKKYPVHPERISKLWQLSQIYLQKNRFFEAETLLAELSQKTEGLLKSKSEYWLARKDLDYDHLSEALSHLESCISGNKNLAEVEHGYVLRIYVLARLERWKAAELAANEFLDKYPFSEYANYGSLVAAEAYFHQQQYEKTIDEIQLLIPLLTTDEEIERSQLLLAESYAQLKSWKDAIIVYGKIETDFPNSFQIDWVRFRLAYSLMSDGQRIKAEKEISKISQNSFLLPFKKALQIEIWKYNGSLDKIIESDFQSLSGQPLLSVYNLNHRIWAASKLDRWDVYRKDLLSLEKQPLLFMPLDSMWAQLGQLSFNNKNFALSSEAYQRSINFNKKLNKSVWPEVYYNAGLAFFKSGKFDQSKSFFEEFTQKFSGNSLAGDAFVYSLLCLKELNEFDTLLSCIKKERDKFPKWYDTVDLINAEVLFETGNEYEGLELFEKKIRYAQSDSLKIRTIYLAAKLTLLNGRPDLSLSKLRILNRFYPQYFSSEVELMQILAEYQIQSYAYLTNRLSDYRSKFGISGDQFLIPVEVDLLGKRGELKPDFVVESILKMKSIESISYILNLAKTYLDQTQFSFVISNQKTRNAILQFGEEGIFLLDCKFPFDSQSDQLTQMRSDFKKIHTLLNSVADTDSETDQMIELFQQVNSEWIRQHLLVDFIKYGKINLLKRLMDENILNQYHIDLLKENLSLNDYADLSDTAIQFLLELGSKPTPELLKLHFYGGVSKYYEKTKDNNLSEFYRNEALSKIRISSEYIDFQTSDLMSEALKNNWDVVEEKKGSLSFELPQYIGKKLDDLKLNYDFSTMNAEEFSESVNEYSEKYSNDESSTSNAFLLKVKSILADKKNKKRKNQAKALVTSFIKKNPKSEVVSELKKLVR